MILSKKSRYGLRSLIDMAVNSSSGHIALYSIAERNGISPQYLEQVFASLRRAGIVKSVKGPQGGYLLNRDPEEIPVSEILKVLDGSYWIEEEKIQHDVQMSGIPATIQHMIIDEINDRLDEYLSGITLEDLKKDYVDNYQESQDMYYI